MEVFVAVVEKGSFVAAANALDLSAVMVTKHVAALERRVGVKLLNRTTRSLGLTEIGEHYYQQSRQILELFAQANDSTELMRATVRGSLKISAPMAFGTECLAPALPEFLASYPEVQIDLELSSRNANLVEEGLDAVIRVGHLSDSSLIARPLRTYGTAICASAAYLKQYGTPQTPDELKYHHLLDYSHWTSQTRWRFGERVSDLPMSRLRSNNGNVLKQAAMAGVGVLMQAEVLVREELNDGRLIPIMQDYWPPARPMHLIYPKDRQHSQKLTSFIDFVMARFRLE